MIVRYGKERKKINHLSGPTSFYYLVPKNKKSVLPLIILLGDTHGSEEKSGQHYTCPPALKCAEKEDCISNDKEDCCFSLSNPNFLEILSQQTEFSYPIDIYTEHWSHEYDKRDQEITFDDSELDRIEKTLKRYTRKSDRKKTIQIAGKNVDLLRVKVKKEKREDKREDEKVCLVCGKSIHDKIYYIDTKKSKYHVKCTVNIRWQSADARRSFSRKTVENELSNIYWEMTNSDYKLKQYHIYLLLCLMKVNGVSMMNESYQKNKKYVFPEISLKNKYEIDIENFVHYYFDMIYSDECPLFSVILKQIKKSHKTPDLWKRIYLRSYETFRNKAYFNPYKIFSLFSILYKKIYSPEKLSENDIEKEVEFVSLPLLIVFAPFLDMYTLLRMFNMNKEGVEKEKEKRSVLNILYAGGSHTANIYRLLTTKDSLYPEYSIDDYTQVSADIYWEDQRCLSLKSLKNKEDRRDINLYKDISDRKKVFESTS